MVQYRPNARGRVLKPHGLDRDANGKMTRFYRIWIEMRSRCMNPNRPHYKWYGGKGIKVCDRWYHFMNFYADMHEAYLKHVASHGEHQTTIDRIDSKGHYAPENCKWSTRYAQALNTSRTRLYKFKGSLLPMKEIAEQTKMHPTTLWCRVHKQGMTLDDAISKSLRKPRVN